jgi:hypothetical protein
MAVDITTMPFRFCWADVDPDAWPVGDDLETRARTLAVEALMDTPLRLGGGDGPQNASAKSKKKQKERAGREDDTYRARCEGAIALAFGRALGVWAGGFRWARDEGSIGGGVVSAWCCASHSVVVKGETSLEPTAARAAAGLMQWRGWLETLRASFVDLDPFAVADDGTTAQDDVDANNAAIARRLDAACAELVALVVEQTGAGDAWYNHMAQVLSWYLQCHGASVEGADDAADAALGGRFASWTGPDAATVAAASSDWTRPARLALAAGQRRRPRR